MTRDELIAHAMECPGAVEDYPFGDELLTVKVGGKVFAWIPLTEVGWFGHGIRVALKARPEVVADLRHVYPSDVRGARPLDERYWVAICLGGKIGDGEVRELLDSSYTAVVSGCHDGYARPVRIGAE